MDRRFDADRFLELPEPDAARFFFFEGERFLDRDRCLDFERFRDDARFFDAERLFDAECFLERRAFGDADLCRAWLDAELLFAFLRFFGETFLFALPRFSAACNSRVATATASSAAFPCS